MQITLLFTKVMLESHVHAPKLPKREMFQRLEQIDGTMTSGDIFKGIFGLAVRLLGLVFLYFGLSAIPPLLDMGAIETAAGSDIVTAVLPVVFNLLVAWWLIGGGMLVRRAYPEAFRTAPHPGRRGESTESQIQTGHTPGSSAMEAADKKLESLVEKSK